MPTYEYACSSCQHQWEAEQSIKDAPLTECPSCHAEAAKRQISRGTGFILKGGGWYSDLYASSSNKGGDAKAAASTSSGSSDSGSSSSGSSSSSDSSSSSSSSSGGSSSGGSSSSGSSSSSTSST
jgi:putative FmdB family regulatory protein